MSGQLASSIDTVRADSFSRTPPLLNSSLNTAKIIQSLNLTDAIIDDSHSTKIVASQSNTIHADSSAKTAPRL